MTKKDYEELFGREWKEMRAKTEEQFVTYCFFVLICNSSLLLKDRVGLKKLQVN